MARYTYVYFMKVSTPILVFTQALVSIQTIPRLLNRDRDNKRDTFPRPRPRLMAKNRDTHDSVERELRKRR